MIALSCGGTEERGRGFYMIDVTKLNDSVITINSRNTRYGYHVDHREKNNCKRK